MDELKNKAAKAKASLNSLISLSSEEKNHALLEIADALESKSSYILEENKKDLDKALSSGISEGLLDRLTLSEERIKAMAQGVRQIAQLQDPIGEIIETFTRPNGLFIEKVRVPLGVIGIIYEARPNVTVDCCALAIKTGNAVLLRGSANALNSNKALIKVITEALASTKVPEAAVALVESPDKSLVASMLKLKEYIDVLIPRGGAGLINYVVENSLIPVLETGVGNCHIYIDEDASYPMAEGIVLNSKTQRIGVCNATESLLVNRKWAKKHLSSLCSALKTAGVELRGCPLTMEYLKDMKPAEESDWGTEYLDMILSVKIVEDVKEAIDHINTYGTKHTEAIITENLDNARLFMQLVDAAAVNHNASTRFTDGFEYGFGAEIGISTQKLHARGPMGLKELTSYKYLVHGQGQIRK